MAAPPQWEPSRGWAGPTGSSPRNTRPRLPAAACTGGAPPGTAALGRSSGEEREERQRERSRVKDALNGGRKMGTGARRERSGKEWRKRMEVTGEFEREPGRGRGESGVM